MDLEEKGIYTVHEFTKAVKGFLLNEHLSDVWIRGEISNYTKHNSGHLYFTLKDKNSQLQCVMFKWYCKNLRFEIEYGMKVIILGDIDVYEPKGQYQLKVRAVRPDGVGELYTAFEQLKNRLALEGLFSTQYKKTLPEFPERIGVATSETGAAVHDIMTVLNRRFPAKILFVPTVVQGDYASESIIRSLDTLNRSDVDVIILGRGGGSIEDLWAFNEEKVARAIFDSNIPVISAVGHETDYTISDFVADVRAPTPSAAAEIAVPDIQEVLTRIKNLKNRMVKHQILEINEKKNMINELKKGVDIRLFYEKLVNYIQFIDDLSHKEILNIKHSIETRELLLKNFTDRLAAVNPLEVLSRGYSITLKIPDKIRIKSINEVEKDDDVTIIVSDGEINCNVISKEGRKWK